MKEFEAAYGPTGAWAQLFQRGAGFVGTTLDRMPGTLEYRVVDRWESATAWDAFRSSQRAAYERLDRECEALTEEETLVDEYVEPVPEGP